MDYFYRIQKAYDQRKTQVEEQPNHNRRLRELSRRCPYTISEYLIQRRETFNKLEQEGGNFSITNVVKAIEEQEKHAEVMRKIFNLSDFEGCERIYNLTQIEISNKNVKKDNNNSSS